MDTTLLSAKKEAAFAICPSDVPVSLYVHFPWCVRKCPYCDLNSFEATAAIPQLRYLSTLIAEFENRKASVGTRAMCSVFFGGGTPSLMSPDSVRAILTAAIEPSQIGAIEVSLEANPGAVDVENFLGFRSAGVTRLSIGAQSFRDDFLKSIGRIHSSDQVRDCLKHAQKLKFPQINLDVMFGLPGDSMRGIVFDLESAIALEPDHISWYSFTLEPNTPLFAAPPTLPDEEEISDAFMFGQDLLARAGYERYEISAYARRGGECAHNVNYWQYGDYLGLGAGAHSKLTTPSGDIVRQENWRTPKRYMESQNVCGVRTVGESDRMFEFMLNALRLTSGFSAQMFRDRTGLAAETLEAAIKPAVSKGYVAFEHGVVSPTSLGLRFLNDVQAMFLPD